MNEAIVVPGDILNGTRYYAAAKLMFNWAVEANDRGDVFPLWGTCLGFEFLGAVCFLFTPYWFVSVLHLCNYYLIHY